MTGIMSPERNCDRQADPYNSVLVASNLASSASRAEGLHDLVAAEGFLTCPFSSPSFFCWMTNCFWERLAIRAMKIIASGSMPKSPTSSAHDREHHDDRAEKRDCGGEYLDETLVQVLPTVSMSLVIRRGYRHVSSRRNSGGTSGGFCH
jgi:hypothetical protein